MPNKYDTCNMKGYVFNSIYAQTFFPYRLVILQQGWSHPNHPRDTW